MISSALIYNANKINKEINTENLEVKIPQDTSHEFEYEEQEKNPNELELGENRENVSGPDEKSQEGVSETNKGNGPN